jgi:hypothetical protein
VHDLCDELGLRCQVDITAGAARAWTNVDDRNHSPFMFGFLALRSMAIRAASETDGISP